MQASPLNNNGTKSQSEEGLLMLRCEAQRAVATVCCEAWSPDANTSRPQNGRLSCTERGARGVLPYTKPEGWRMGSPPSPRWPLNKRLLAGISHPIRKRDRRYKVCGE